MIPVEFLTSSHTSSVLMSWSLYMQMIQQTVFSTDQQVAVAHQDIQQCANRGGEEACRLVNMKLNNATFEILPKKQLCKCSGGKKNITPLLELILVSNRECKHLLLVDRDAPQSS